MADDQARIMIWGAPRTMSTALLKCLSFVDGCETWFEPYHYSTKAKDLYLDRYKSPAHAAYPADYKGNEEFFARVARHISDYRGFEIRPERIAIADVKRQLESSTSKYLVVKDVVMRPPDQQLMDHIPSGFKHVFLIRDPVLVYNSYRKAKYEDHKLQRLLQGDGLDERKFDVAKHDTSRKVHNFFKYLHNVWDYVRENIDPEPLVINTKDLRDDPERMLSYFCEYTGLPYQDSMLQWDASNEIVKTWRAAGDHVLMSVHSFFNAAVTSTEFLPAKKPMPRDQLTPDVVRLVDAAAPFYNDMNEYRFT